MVLVTVRCWKHPTGDDSDPQEISEGGRHLGRACRHPCIPVAKLLRTTERTERTKDWRRTVSMFDSDPIMQKMSAEG